MASEERRVLWLQQQGYKDKGPARTRDLERIPVLLLSRPDSTLSADHPQSPFEEVVSSPQPIAHQGAHQAEEVDVDGLLADVFFSEVEEELDVQSSEQELVESSEEEEEDSDAFVADGLLRRPVSVTAKGAVKRRRVCRKGKGTTQRVNTERQDPGWATDLSSDDEGKVDQRMLKLQREGCGHLPWRGPVFNADRHTRKCGTQVLERFCHYRNISGVQCRHKMRKVRVLYDDLAQGPTAQRWRTRLQISSKLPHQDHTTEVKTTKRRGVPKHVEQLISPSKRHMTTSALRLALKEQDWQPQSKQENQGLVYLRRKLKLEAQRKEVKQELENTNVGLEAWCEANTRGARLQELGDKFSCYTSYVIDGYIIEGQHIVLMLTSDQLIFNGVIQQHGPMETLWCVDSTHKLVREGHGVFAVGTTDVSQRFRKMACGPMSEKSEKAHLDAMMMVKAEVQRVHARQLLLGPTEVSGMPIAPKPPVRPVGQQPQPKPAAPLSPEPEDRQVSE